MSTFKTLLKTTFIVTYACLVTACVTQKLPLTETQSIRKIAVLSELGSHMNKVMIGTSIFDKKSMQSNINAVDINHSIENDIAQKLWSKGTEVVILQTSTAEIMQTNKKLLINQESYKGASVVILVKPIYQKEEYPLFPAGYGVLEKNTLGIKQRLLYASIIYEVYSTKDGSRIAYYVVHPEGSDAMKLKRDISFEQLTEAKMTEYKPQLYTLLDHINTSALQNLRLY